MKKTNYFSVFLKYLIHTKVLENLIQHGKNIQNPCRRLHFRNYFLLNICVINTIPQDFKADPHTIKI